MATKQRSFSVRKLALPERVPGRESLPPSIPLVIRNDHEYSFAKNSLTKKSADNQVKTASQLRLVDEAVELLKSIEKPLAVAAICGPYRTGKSYFLSRMLGSSDAFDLGHTMHACTHGIWMGTSVLECDDFVMLLLDTEGIDSVSASGTEDARILVMTILLSSYLIYNSQRVPTKSDLEKMRLENSDWPNNIIACV